MNSSTPSTWLALDVGGANLKAAHSSGQARSFPFEVWKRPEELPQAIARLIHILPPADRVALTMTAELCDCYPTKAVGVRSVVDAVLLGVHGRPVLVWGRMESSMRSTRSTRIRRSQRRPTGWRWRPWPLG
jgi:uncharacterized hydantoinase/oxoprolinase family protein